MATTAAYSSMAVASARARTRVCDAALIDLPLRSRANATSNPASRLAC